MNTYREYHWILSEQRELKQKGYAAITYTDHREDGRKVKGTEDFSAERFYRLTSRTVYVPTGEKDRGGHRRWQAAGTVRSNSVRDCGKIARMVFAGKEISIREN